MKEKKKSKEKEERKGEDKTKEYIWRKRSE